MYGYVLSSLKRILNRGKFSFIKDCSKRRASASVLVENVSFLPDEKEVAEIFEVPLEFILAKENMTLHLREIDGKKRGYYAIPYGPYYIWGATARIIKSFSDLIHG